MIVGHTRFSLYAPASGAWVASRNSTFASADEYQRYLFSDDRLEPRADIFLNFTVPMLERASHGHDFIHVVSYSDCLPKVYKDRLRVAADSSAILLLDEVAEGSRPQNVARTARKWMTAHDMDETSPFGVMRLDDDDILSIDYFDQMAPYITSSHVGYVVSLARGITAFYDDGRYYYARESVYPLHSKGHLSVCAWDAKTNLHSPVKSAHTHSDQHNPVILDSRRISYLWTRAAIQDGSLLGTGSVERIYREMSVYPEAAQDFARTFPILRGLIGTEQK